jgi:hypothetical protein
MGMFVSTSPAPAGGAIGPPFSLANPTRMGVWGIGPKFGSRDYLIMFGLWLVVVAIFLLIRG